MMLAPVAVLDVFGPLDLTGQESAAQGAIRDEPDLELANRRQDLVLDVTAPERVLRLQRGNRRDSVRPPDSLCGRLRQTEIADLPLLNEIGHRADGLFDRDGAID